MLQRLRQRPGSRLLEGGPATFQFLDAVLVEFGLFITQRPGLLHQCLQSHSARAVSGQTLRMLPDLLNQSGKTLCQWLVFIRRGRQRLPVVKGGPQAGKEILRGRCSPAVRVVHSGQQLLEIHADVTSFSLLRCELLNPGSDLFPCTPVTCAELR